MAGRVMMEVINTRHKYADRVTLLMCAIKDETQILSRKV